MKSRRLDERVVLRAAVAILLLNLLDAMMTIAVVYGDLATEANPLMAAPLDSYGAVGFMIIKLALVSLGVALLWRFRERRTAIFALGSLAGVYVLIALYHVRSAQLLAKLITGGQAV